MRLPRSAGVSLTPLLSALGRISIVQSWCSRTRRFKEPKTGESRVVPIHPVLAAILASWRLEHWPRIFGRAPTEDDLVVPNANMTPINNADANHRKREDFELLGLRLRAGKHRQRGGHDMRAFYQTRCIEDGGDSTIIRCTTHAPDKSVNGGYERFSWPTICREVGKFRIGILDGKVLPLAAGLLQHEAGVREALEKTGRAQQDSNPKERDTKL